MKLPNANLKTVYIPLRGGEDLISTTVEIDPGSAMLTYNYELDVNGRYRRIDGYEAFDGRPKPSEASYWLLNYKAGFTSILVGSVITGLGASGEVLEITLTSGSWISGTAAGQMVLFNVTGAFVDGEAIKVSAVTRAYADGASTERNYSDDITDNIALLDAIEATRADIGAVPGSGNILGVWQYKGVKYAFRNNAGATAVGMYKSTSSGWTACSLGERLGFDTGSVAFVEGETITRLGVTAVIRRVVVKTGTWAGGTAAGFFSITGRAGGDFAAGAATGSIAGAASITGIQTANAFSIPSGRFEFYNENFGGHASTQRMYGCDGKNKAFQWDGTYFTPIETGMTDDTPKHIYAHKNHLFLGFAGGSIQHSSIGNPLVWSAVTGAAEMGAGDELAGFLAVPDALGIFARNSIKILSGTGSASWVLKPFSNEVGAIEWSMQVLGSGIFLDDRGLTALSAAQEYGDFKANTLSKLIEPYLRQRLGLIQGSVRVKEKNQYRLFFNDLEAFTMTMAGSKVVGFTRQRYNHQPTCMCSSENLSGKEEIFFGSTDGFVYQMDSGNSFNGEPIESLVKLNFNHLKSPSVKKRIRRIILMLDTAINTFLQASMEFDYGDTSNPGAYFKSDSPGGIWAVNDWNDFVWKGKGTNSYQIDIDGTALNFSLTIYSSGEFQLQANETTPQTGITNDTPHTLQGYIVHYDTKGIQR